MSEEKEVSVQRLKDEHQNSEQKIQQLEKQNVVIAQERESILWKYPYRDALPRLLFFTYLNIINITTNFTTV